MGKELSPQVTIFRTSDAKISSHRAVLPRMLCRSFPKDCKNKLPDKAASTSRTSLNFIEVIPSPSTSEGETDKISLKVVTRAQAKKDAQVQTDESGDSAKPALKRKTRRKVRSKKAESVKNDSKEEREQTGKKQKSENEPHPSAKEQMLTSSGTSSGGSVIVDKVYEPLQAALRRL